ncbi:MAG: DEAD/DEAH box helicase [Gammaproteobacteria bacterium]
MPAEPGAYADFPLDLDARIAQALRARGIEKLYSHQREAWDLVRKGRHAVVVTPTASGKSLCFNLPVLHAAVNESARALYLFPTKALSQDQVTELIEIERAGNLGVRAFTFDGDTPGDARAAVRSRGDVVVSNPDMLHQGILPHHTKWAQFFESLRYVVIDELHTYRGVFGSHTANVVRRLRRICRFYGANPVFIMCSATIANPTELASRLIEDEVTGIGRSGAPRGAKTLLFWNPPVVNRALGIRTSARSQSSRIAREAVRAGLKTIVFAQTRVMVEVLTKYLKDEFDRDPRKPARVRAYRGGYLPTERRRTEQELRGGEVDCVVATSALELGVDIGALDVCLLNGYPGTIAGTWQRRGRAGRRERDALGVLIATSQPLDQFIVRNPEFFLGGSPEHARIDPDQLLILLDHVRCAAFELPFGDGEPFGQVDVTELLEYLADEHTLHRQGGKWHWMTDSYPANTVGLRTVAEGNFVVIDITGGAKNVIAEVDYSGAAMTLYEGAIYMVQARTWQVERLDWEGRKAFVRKVDADYYTEAIDYTRLKVLEQFDGTASANAATAHGEVHLVRRVAGFKKIRYYTHENIGYGKVNLPDQEMHTTAVWWRLEPAVIERSFGSRHDALDGFLGTAYAMHFVAALITLSEKHDIGRSVGSGNGVWSSARDGAPREDDPLREGPAELCAPDMDPRATGAGSVHSVGDVFEPTVYLYDNYPGGIGLSAPLYECREEVVERALSLVSACGCASGCPACVGPVLASDEGRPPGAATPKSLALRVLELFAGRGDCNPRECDGIAVVSSQHLPKRRTNR